MQMIPAKLRSIVARHHGRYHRIAHELGVNVGHVYNLLRKGREPKRQDIRKKMFLPKTRKPRKPDFRPEHINWWRHLDKSQRDSIIKRAYHDHLHDL